MSSLALIAAALLAPAPLAGATPLAPRVGTESTVTWSAPEYFVRGGPFPVTVTIEVAEGGATIPAWLATASAFELDGQPLGERGEATLPYPGAATLALTLDLGPELKDAPERFRLGHAGAPAGEEPRSVQVLAPAPEGLDFMKIEAERLVGFRVLLDTNRGQMLFELWPDVAPNHVRNFLDLAYTGFYDGLDFHRVWPGFMIQGGDPLRKGRPKPPRSVDREFSDRKHVRGVLSMARAGHPDSATCQFFVMHAAAPTLDGQYSAFGKLLTGYDTLDRIANAPGDPIPGAGGNEPHEEQTILHATVLRATPDSSEGEEG